MLTKQQVENHINNCLKNTDFPLTKRRGKVRDIYDLGDKLLFVASDRVSAFDRDIAVIPFKGQVLNMASAFWFEKTKDIVANHIIDIPDPNVSVTKKFTIFPVEFVVRGYLTGSTSTSAWTAYKNGEREFCGHTLPEGMVKNEKFKKPLLTPTTKDDKHDEKISAEEIVSRGMMTQEMWDKASKIALALYDRGVEITSKNNLILVDTKYEMGYDEKGNIYLCDEIHTPDSSRFWIKDTYEEQFRAGKDPQNIDKEFLRLWFRDNCDPYNDKELPAAPKELIVELSLRYQQLYEMVTGQKFFVDTDEDIHERIKKNIKKYLV